VAEEGSLAARQAELIAETRATLYELLGSSVSASDIVAFFDSNVVDMLQRREEVFAAAMMGAYKAQLSTQIQGAYTKAAGAAARADRAEKEVEKLQARLSRRADAWDRERSGMYRQILALRELLRRHGVADARLPGLPASLAGGDGDDPLRSAKTKALEARLRRAEEETAGSAGRARKADAMVDRLRQELRDMQDRLAAAEGSAGAARDETQRLR